MKTNITDGTLEHVKHLAVDIGSRPIGSAANLAAADYIASTFTQAGLSVETQDFFVPRWTMEHVSLEQDGLPLEAYANNFSPSCDVRGATILACTLSELEAAPIRGAILVLYGDLTQTELATKGGIYVSDRDRRIIDILERQQPAGIITVNPTLHASWRLIEDFDLDLPSVTVSARSGLQLLKHPGASVAMKIGASRSPGHSANVVGRLTGDVAERIVLCAHYDTKLDTPGAYDNAAGVGVLLTLSQRLARRKLRHTLECIAFSGEEGAGLGDMEYARRAGDGFNRVTAAINFDGVGPFTGTSTVALFAASQELSDLLDRVTAEDPGVLRVPPWPASDHYIFYSHGTPSIAFTSTGIRDIYHTEFDTVDWISAAKLSQVASLALDLIEALDLNGPSWTRPKKTL